MNYYVFKLLSEIQLRSLVTELMMCSDWHDGAVTAKGGAKAIKRNLQLSSQSNAYEELSTYISDLLMKEVTVMQHQIFPKKVINILFSRSSAGMYYGSHVDGSHTPQGRRDYSFTLFLNNPKDYDGGELILNIPPEKKSIKLDAGAIIIYPTKYVHEVREVTRGERIVCVGWIESYLKKDNERELLGYVSQAKILASEAEHVDTRLILILNLLLNSLKKYFGD